MPFIVHLKRASSEESSIQPQLKLVLLRFQNVSCRSVSVGFVEKNLGFRFGLGFHDKRIVNFFMTRAIWQNFHHH